MTVKELLKNHLSMLQYDKYETNLRNEKGLNFAESILSQEAILFADFYILTGFQWVKTPEGDAYWNKIFRFLNRIENEKKDTGKR